MDTAIHAIINVKYERCVRRVVHRLRRVSAKDWDIDDSPMRTLWDHWKREMQDEHSVFHDLIEDMVEANVHHVVERLSQEDGALLTLGTDALYDLDEEPDGMIFVPDEVATELMRRLNERACNEPHRREVRQLLDDQAFDRYERDNE